MGLVPASGAGLYLSPLREALQDQVYSALVPLELIRSSMKGGSRHGGEGTSIPCLVPAQSCGK